jgi:hypothetical protein
MSTRTETVKIRLIHYEEIIGGRKHYKSGI